MTREEFILKISNEEDVVSETVYADKMIDLRPYDDPITEENENDVSVLIEDVSFAPIDGFQPQCAISNDPLSMPMLLVNCPNTNIALGENINYERERE